MKLHNIYKIALLFLIFGLQTSCQKKDFLQRSPSDLIDVENVFSNLENAEAFLNNAYREVDNLVFRQYITGGSYYNLGSATDEAAGMWIIPQSNISFNNGSWSAASFPLQWAWGGYYADIHRIHIFLKNYDLIPDEAGETNNSKRKQRMLGEAYALRAYYYFLLFRMWGEVPLIKDALLPGGEQETKLPRSPIEEVVAFIDADIQRAIEILPASYSDSEFGRFTSVAAMALRSRLYTYYASPLFNPTNDKKRWEIAEKASLDAINFATQNGCAFSATDLNGKGAYERIFQEMKNSEIIWSVSSPYSGGHHDYWDFWAGSLGRGGWYGEGPVQNLVDDYEMLNGELPILGYDAQGNQIPNPAANYNPSKPFDNRDKRFSQTILYHGAQWKGTPVNIAPGGTDYTPDRGRVNYFWKKYMNEDRNLRTSTGKKPIRFIIFRLSELYLNYAEARNENLANPDLTVHEYINKLRTRGGLPNLPIGLDKEQMRTRIIRERRIEMAMENLRFFDVRRLKIAEIVDNRPVRSIRYENGKLIYPIFGERVFNKDKHYLFPIPQSEIDKSRGVLKQNPGW